MALFVDWLLSEKNTEQNVGILIMSEAKYRILYHKLKIVLIKK